MCLFIFEGADEMVADVQVSDTDSGPGGSIECLLDNNYFAMEEYYHGMYRLVALQSFDREQKDRYTVSIQCNDHGTPPLSSTLTIPIVITDLNDHKPHFSKPVFTTSITENNLPGATIITVDAKDFDEGANAEITYHLEGIDIENILSIDAINGHISALEPLDYETRRRLEMIVVATDDGDPQQSSSVTVDINIMDLDDEAPVFPERDYTFWTLENQMIGTEIATVQAQDVDSPYITYSLETNASPNVFDIDPTSGRIYLTQVSTYNLGNSMIYYKKCKSGNQPKNDKGYRILVGFLKNPNRNYPHGM